MRLDKKIFFRLLLALVFVVGIVTQTNVQQIIERSRALSVWWVWVAFGLASAMTFLKAWQYFLVLPQGIAYEEVLQVIVEQNLVSNFVANSAGIVSGIAILKTRHRVDLSKSSVAVVIVKVGDLVATALYLLLSTALLWNSVPAWRVIALLIVAGITLGAGVFLLMLLQWKQSVARIKRFAEWLHINQWAVVPKVFTGLEHLSSSQDPILCTAIRVWSVSFVYLGVSLLLGYTLLRSVGVAVNLWVVFFVVGLLQILSIVPVQIFGGLGVADASAVYLYHLFGLAPDRMSAAVLISRPLFYLLALSQVIWLFLSRWRLRR